MLGRLAQSMLLACLMCGLCAPAQANTTGPAAEPVTGAVPMPVVGGSRPLTVPPAPAAAPMAPATPTTPASSSTPAVPAVSPVAPAAPAASSGATARPIRIGLLLPLQSEVFGAAAQAVRTGFQSAYEREADGVEIAVLETGDGARQIDAIYADAQERFDIIVGPLARADVATIAQSGKVRKPTLALAHPDVAGDAEPVLPAAMLPIGLSIEDEARQVANWAAAGRKMARAFAISGNAAWQRRAARAFVSQWQQRGQEAQALEVSVSGAYVGASSMVLLKKRLQEEKPALLFLALDDAQARQLLQAIGREQPVYGTSQLNPLSVSDWRTGDMRPEMNGVRLVDMPWQLLPDHPAVMSYPRQVVAADQRANPDMERLYALGIDAFRIAREIALQHKEFELDGVTGKLTVRFGKGIPFFQRIEQPASYVDGVVTPLQR